MRQNPAVQAKLGLPMNRTTSYSLLLLSGIALAVIAFQLLALFETDAFVISTALAQHDKAFSEVVAYIAVRYWSIFALAVGAGFVAMRLTSTRGATAVALLALPWLLAATAVNTLECLQAGEAATCWLNYRPLYLFVSAFLTLPLGVWFASVILALRFGGAREA